MYRRFQWRFITTFSAAIERFTQSGKKTLNQWNNKKNNYFFLNQELKTNITSTNPRFSVSGLNPGYQYVASIFAFNSKGKSEAVVHQISMLRQPEKQLTAEKGF